MSGFRCACGVEWEGSTPFCESCGASFVCTFRCESCDDVFEGSAGPNRCDACGNKYVVWLNREDD